MFKTDAIILLVLALNVILIAVMAFAIKSLTASVNALVQERAVVSPERAVVPTERAVVSPERVVVPSEAAAEKPISTGNVTPMLIAVITGAIAAYLDDRDLERHSISTIQLAEPQH